MKLLYLLRHAKSSWDDLAAGDFDRPLNKRGVRAAGLMAEHFARAGIRPAYVLCSPSARTRQTLEPFLEWLGDVPVVFESRLYEASPTTLLTLLARLPAAAGSVLVIGHNPGLERLAASLIGEAGTTPLADRLRAKYPTGALAALSTPADSWSAVRPGSCRLDDFVRPSDLEGEGLGRL